jgi:hypothetical protein
MKRREFLKSSLAASTLVGLSCSAAEAAEAASPSSTKQEYYELRAYRHKGVGNRELLDDYLEKAAIPALNRLSARPVGAFVQQPRTGTPAGTEVRDESVVWILIPHPSVESFATAWKRLDADAEYRQAGAKYLESPKGSPAFERIDSWLMLAFAGMPKVELPAYSREKKDRMFEMRTYESHSELKALKKVEMFNSGEIETMREVGLAPVFYGQVLVGANLPHLTYMLSAENQAEHDKHWKGFRDHPTWKRLQADPRYADTVSKIYNRFLVPTSYSQI